jgi:hypothetical protein
LNLSQCKSCPRARVDYEWMSGQSMISNNIQQSRLSNESSSRPEISAGSEQINAALKRYNGNA